jgi:hypothetical protein
VKSIFAAVLLCLVADPDVLIKSVAAWSLAVLMIAVILCTTYHGLRFLILWLFPDRREKDVT